MHHMHGPRQEQVRANNKALMNAHIARQCQMTSQMDTWLGQSPMNPLGTWRDQKASASTNFRTMDSNDEHGGI